MRAPCGGQRERIAWSHEQRWHEGEAKGEEVTTKKKKRRRGKSKGEKAKMREYIEAKRRARGGRIQTSKVGPMAQIGVPARKLESAAPSEGWESDSNVESGTYGPNWGPGQKA